MAKFDTVNDGSWVMAGKLTLSGTSTVTSSLIDMQGYNSLDIVFLNALVTDAGTASGFTAKLQESDTTAAVSFTDVAAADTPNGSASVIVTLDNADDTIAGVLGYVGNKRYVRVSATGTAASDAIQYILGRRSHAGSAPLTIIGASTAAT